MVFPGCLVHAKGWRICIFLQRPWAFSYCHSSLYCSKFLCFWLVSSLTNLYFFSICGTMDLDIEIEKSWPSMGDRLKKSLPEKYQKRTEVSILTAVLSASLATLTCYPLDTVRRQMQLRDTPYMTILDAFSGEGCSCLLFSAWNLCHHIFIFRAFIYLTSEIYKSNVWRICFMCCIIIYKVMLLFFGPRYCVYNCSN